MSAGYGDLGERCMAVAGRLEREGALADAYDVRLLVEQRDRVRKVLDDFDEVSRVDNVLGRFVRALSSAVGSSLEVT